MLTNMNWCNKLVVVCSKLQIFAYQVENKLKHTIVG